MSWWWIVLIIVFVAYLPIWLFLMLVFVRKIPFLFIRLPIWAWITFPTFLYRRGVAIQMQDSVNDFVDQMKEAGIDMSGLDDKDKN